MWIVPARPSSKHSSSPSFGYYLWKRSYLRSFYWICSSECFTLSTSQSSPASISMLPLLNSLLLSPRMRKNLATMFICGTSPSTSKSRLLLNGEDIIYDEQDIVEFPFWIGSFSINLIRDYDMNKTTFNYTDITGFTFCTLRVCFFGTNMESGTIFFNQRTDLRISCPTKAPTAKP